MDYYTILTDAGRALEAAALAGQARYTLGTCVLGDSTEMPDPAQNSIRNEVWRGPISTLTQDPDNPTWLVIEVNVPPSDGGFTIREFGIYTDTGVLFAVGNYPETYKPAITEGTGVDLVVRPICEVSNATLVTLLTDTSIMMASKKYVDEQIENIQRRNIGEVFYYQGRSAPYGALVADGGLVRRDMYPDLWKFAQDQNLVIAETAWQTQLSTQGSVGVYSTGDGSATFRLPLLTDFFRGTITPDTVGTWQTDAIRNIKGRLPGYLTASGGGTEPQAAATSALYWSSSPNATRSAVVTTKDAYDGLAVDVSRAVPTASENRPKTLFLLPCIYAYNAIAPRAQVDIHKYLIALDGKLDKADYRDQPGMVVFDTPGTHEYVVPHTGRYKVTIVGGGGSGGAAGATSAAIGAAASGGNAGGSCIKVVHLSRGSTISITVGKGGPAQVWAGSTGTAKAGDAGTTSSFGTICSATGGAGGLSAINTTTSHWMRHPNNEDATQAFGVGGDLNMLGALGAASTPSTAATTGVMAGAGGDSILSGGGKGGWTTIGHDGSPGRYGSGGGGGEAVGGSYTGNGGKGGDGVVLVEW